MKELLTIRQQDIEPEYIEREDVEYRDRYAARAVLKDALGRVALLFAGTRGYYKLPGGGVEEGEDKSLALTRELLEEVGAKAKVTSEIGRIEEWRVSADKALHQISDAFSAHVIGDIGEPSFTEKELADGFEVLWAKDIDEAIERVSRTLEHNDFEVRFMSLRDKTILEAAKDTND